MTTHRVPDAQAAKAETGQGCCASQGDAAPRPDAPAKQAARAAGHATGAAADPAAPATRGCGCG